MMENLRTGFNKRNRHTIIYTDVVKIEAKI